MGKTIAIVAFLVVALGGYGMGGVLSFDALAMAIGVLVGIPTALLILAGGRRDLVEYWRIRAMKAEERYRIVDKG